MVSSLMKKRRSIRKFTRQPIRHESLLNMVGLRKACAVRRKQAALKIYDFRG